MGTRGFSDELLAFPGRPTRALVDLDVLQENARRLRARLGPAELMAVVKADGYGHGAVPVAREALLGGAAWLGVATVAEGVELRSAGIDVQILILGPIVAAEVDSAVAGGLDITVGDESLGADVVRRAVEGSALPRLHIKVDTGMRRYGLAPRDAIALLGKLEETSHPAPYALCTHFAAADEPDGEITTHQERIFRDVADEALRLRPEIRLHTANSAASLSPLPAGSDIARVGIALYGCGVTSAHLAAVGLRPAMSVVSQVIRVHEIGAGDGVSYGHTYRADGPERIGLIPIGYADGYSRSLSNRGRMSVAGESVPVRGRVCMDQTVVGELPGSVRAGDWVGVVGPAMGGPAWDDLAEGAGTISYELLTSVSRRVARLYHRSGRLVTVRDELGRYREVEDNNNAPPADRREGRVAASLDQ